MPAPRKDYAQLIGALSETDKARLAAYIDCEGTIYINVCKKLYGRMKNAQYRLSLAITNTDYRLMDWLKRKTDGSVYFVKYEKSKHLGSKQIMRWQVNERLAETVLIAVLPYMLVKRPQAEVGLSFMSLKKSRKIVERDSKGRLMSASLTESEMAARLTMKLEIERLNASNGSELVN